MLHPFLALALLSAPSPDVHLHQELEAHERDPERTKMLDEAQHPDHRHADGHGEAPAGTLLVYCVGSSMDAARAADLEAALVDVAERQTHLTPISGTAAKRNMRGLPPECHEVGQCMAVLARDLRSRYVLTCSDQGAQVNLRLWDLERAEVVGEVARAPQDAGSGVEVLLTKGQARAQTKSGQREASQQAPFVRPTASSSNFPPLKTVVPFWMSLGTTAMFLGASLYTTAQFNLAQDSYNLKVTSRRELRGSDVLAAGARVTHTATVGNVLWGVTAGAAVLTTLLAILTDWVGDGEHTSVGPYASPDGAGAYLHSRW